MEGSTYANFIKTNEPDFYPELVKLQVLRGQREWDDLEWELRKFVAHPTFQKHPFYFRKRFYYDFIEPFQHHLDAVLLVDIVAFVAINSSYPQEAVTFLKHFKPYVDNSLDAVLLCIVLQIQIRCFEMGCDDKACVAVRGLKFEVEDARSDIVRERFYFFSSEYYRLQGDYDQHYTDTIKYLKYLTPPEESPTNLAKHAFLLGISAILSKNLVKFGDALVQPAMQALRQTSKAWMVDLLVAFNRGDLDEYQKLRSEWITVPDLEQKEEKMKRKISVMCLMAMVSRRPDTDRVLDFQEIANEVRASSNQEVELLVRSAQSWGLLTADFDYDLEVLTVSWINTDHSSVTQSTQLNNLMNDWVKDTVKCCKMLQGKLD